MVAVNDTIEDKKPETGEAKALPAQGADKSSNSHHRKRRTVGNIIFDFIVYPLVTFGAIFVASVWGTREGRYGKGWANEQYNNLAEVIEKSPLLKNIPASAEKTRNAKGHAMVLVSFLVGTLLTVPAKLFEDSREKISQFIDRVLGTEPTDPSQYAKEPDQGWRSVIGGRVATFATVLVIDKLIGGKIIDASAKTANFFTKQNIDLKALEDVTAGSKWQTGFVAAFEGIYTALCTTLLYGFSRSFAKIINKKEEDQERRTLAKAVTEAVTNKAKRKVDYLPEEPENKTLEEQNKRFVTNTSKPAMRFNTQPPSNYTDKASSQPREMEIAV